MQKSIDAGAPAQRRQLMLSIACNTLTFVQNPFANYVVQFVLKTRHPEVAEIVNELLLSDLVNLSKQKFSSNVIEKCIEFNSPQMNKNVVRRLIAHQSYCLDMLSD
mmetsp:Transcript_9964/g.16742  ORF Transcript_9964/g.16742 Transcript_9964/m.16742 type:complete len:106 (-) Transcript_9964:29-346(-)